MAAVNKIDSNVVGLRYAEEDSYKTVSGDEVWQPLDPNSYADFGGQITTLARNPINDGRQRKKGVVTDLEAAGGFNQDLTQDNLQDILQGFFFADLNTNVELAVATVDTGGATDDYEPASGGDGYVAGDLLFAKGFDDAENNGLKKVSGVPTATEVISTTALTTATGQTGTISKVGREWAAGVLDVVVTGTWPQITNTAADFDTMGWSVGDWIYVGGDVSGAAGDQFLNAGNNGFMRIKTIAAGAITLDKTQGTMTAESSTAETIRIFSGRVLKNLTGSSISRRTYQLERTLGAPDDASPANIQAEYLTGAVPNQAVFNISTADKVNVDLSFVAATRTTIDGPTSLKAGTLPTLTEGTAFNTSSDVPAIKLAEVVEGSPDQAALFAYLTDLTITVNNNVSPNKAIGTLGAFDVTAGTFEVSASATAYFASVAAVQTVQDNDDASLHCHLVKENSGITFDLPLVSLADARPDVSQDEAITLPIEMQAATASSIDSATDYTMLMVFWDYLPTAAG